MNFLNPKYWSTLKWVECYQYILYAFEQHWFCIRKTLIFFSGILLLHTHSYTCHSPSSSQTLSFFLLLDSTHARIALNVSFSHFIHFSRDTISLSSFFFHFVYFLFLRPSPQCTLGWLPILYLAKDDLEFPIPWPSYSKCGGYRQSVHCHALLGRWAEEFLRAR